MPSTSQYGLKGDIFTSDVSELDFCELSRAELAIYIKQAKYELDFFAMS